MLSKLSGKWMDCLSNELKVLGDLRAPAYPSTFLIFTLQKGKQRSKTNDAPLFRGMENERFPP